MASDGLPTARVKSTPANRVPSRSPGRRLGFEKLLRAWLYLLSVPTLTLGFFLLRAQEASWPSILICELGILLCWSLAASLLAERIVRPLQTLANVVAALREDDYSFRARGTRRDDAMGDLALEVNALAETLQSRRTGALEAMALLERVMASMESPILAFDRQDRLTMLNAAGERAFGASSAKALGRSASQLHLTHLLEARDGELVLLRPNQTDRWVVKRSYFRLRGVRHTLLMLSDVSKALREEERLAWERLIRVLGHEINNSLTPIKSIAGSLRERVPVGEASADFERGLAVIENRAESLNRFLQAYRQLMGLPTPRPERISLAALVHRVVQLEERLRVSVVASKDIVVYVDAIQIEQALINLVRNAVEAALNPDASSETPPCVQLQWTRERDELIISIVDSGLGLTNEANLFVPFYTTKPEGTGIGLVLAQQIAEAHSGSVRLSNRSDAQGCIAELRLAWRETAP
jgi:two-component system, NtrC family, nitrogen regulation sensor histidine kinase NtrY